MLFGREFQMRGPTDRKPREPSVVLSSDILVRKLILVRVFIQFDKNNFSLVLVLVRQKLKILVLVQF